MTFRLLINSIACGALFGFWQNSHEAGCFVVTLCGFVLSCIDYAKEES